jgi:ABC-2 type transport system permease protein
LILPLVENEMLKIFRRRRFRLVVLILTAITALVVFAHWRHERREAGERGPRDWRSDTQHRIVELQNQLRRRLLPPSYVRWLRSEAVRLQYSLDHGFDPNAVNGPMTARNLAAAYSFLFTPLLVTLFASDLVSSEIVEGTIKILLTRPARRWKVLLAKVVCLFSCTTLTVFLLGAVAYLFGGVAFGFRGWGAPMLAGFKFTAGNLDLSGVRQIPLWQDALRIFGLSWFSALAVGCLALFLSVVLRTAAAAMGTMLAALVAGTILPRVASDWDFARYIFVTNLPLPDYYAGSPPPLPGITLGFSALNLALWAAASLAAAFWVFTRQDILG